MEEAASNAPRKNESVAPLKKNSKRSSNGRRGKRSI
jgi:hypothetical protein